MNKGQHFFDNNVIKSTITIIIIEHYYYFNYYLIIKIIYKLFTIYIYNFLIFVNLFRSCLRHC